MGLFHFLKEIHTMIKIYRLRQVRNNVCHILEGKSGNRMRYNFTGGNVATGTCPELSLKSQYAQDLLEDSELFKSGTVVLVRTVRTHDDVVREEAERRAAAAAKKQSGEALVTTPDELLAYINMNYSKKYTEPAKALVFAEKEGLVFPNLKVGE